LISHSRVAWLCLAAFIYTSVTLWSIHGDLLPTQASPLFPNPISPQQWHFDYETAERILTEVKFSENGELLVNSKLAEILSKTINSLPKKINDEALQRIDFLIAMSFPNRPQAAKKLAKLLINYYHLQYATTSASSTNSNSHSTDNKLTDFLKKETLENHYLGEDNAAQLFGKQRSITRYLLERKAIKENTDLNPLQKKQQLNMLQNPLKRSPRQC
jgi:hypothetical protein